MVITVTRLQTITKKMIAVANPLAHPFGVDVVENKMRGIAMAYDGEPLDRILTGRANGLVYVINSSAVDSGDITEFSGVGFPLNAVFAFDSALFERLRSAWASEDVGELKRLWRDAEPLMAAA